MKFAIIAAIFGIAFNQQLLTFGQKPPLNNVNTNKPPLVQTSPIQHQPNGIQITPPPPLPPNNTPPQKSKSVPPPRILNQNYQQSPVSFYPPPPPFNNYKSQKPIQFDDRRFNSLDRNIMPVIPNFRKNIGDNRRKIQRQDDSDSESDIFDRKDFRQMRDWRDFSDMRNNKNVETSFRRPIDFGTKQPFNLESRNLRPNNEKRTMFEPFELNSQRNNPQQPRFNPVDFNQKDVIPNIKFNEYAPKIDSRRNRFDFSHAPTFAPQGQQYPYPVFENRFNEQEYFAPNRLPWQQPSEIGPFMSYRNSFN